MLIQVDQAYSELGQPSSEVRGRGAKILKGEILMLIIELVVHGRSLLWEHKSTRAIGRERLSLEEQETCLVNKRSKKKEKRKKELIY